MTTVEEDRTQARMHGLLAVLRDAETDFRRSPVTDRTSASPILPSTAAELAAGAIGPAHLRVITATIRRIPPSTHPDTTAQAEHTLATAARRFDPAR